MPYAETRLVLLVVDPYLVHCYWRMPAGSSGSAVLRFHGRSPEPFDIDIELESGNWYVPLWSPEESLYAELWVKTADGAFTCLARSQAVRLPRVRPVSAIEQHFMRVEPAEQHAGQQAEIVPPPPASHHTHLEETVPPAKAIIESAPVWQEFAPAVEPPPPPARMASMDLASIAEQNLFPGVSSWR